MQAEPLARVGYPPSISEYRATQNIERLTEAVTRMAEIQARQIDEPIVSRRQFGTGGTVHQGPWGVPGKVEVLVPEEEFSKLQKNSRCSSEHAQVSNGLEVAEESITSEKLEVQSETQSTEPILLMSRKSEQIQLSADFSDIFGIASGVVWRPKNFTRNAEYPKVAADGFYFERRAGGFILRERSTGRYAGSYTYEGSDGKTGIRELEARYGKKPATRRKA